jgi:hypothetical protein
MPVVRTSLLLFACLLWSTGCMKMDSATPQTPDNPDGIDPPRLNPHPTDSVPIRVIAPPTLKVTLEEFYYAPSIPVSPWFCIKDVTKPTDPRNTGHLRRVPMQLHWDGTGYHGVFVKDRFLPGRCLWGFQAVDTVTPSQEATVLYMPGGQNPTYPHRPDQTGELWCGVDPASSPGKVVCTSLSYFAKYPGRVPTALLDAHPTPARTLPSSLVFVDDTTQSVTLRYHDLDAEARLVTHR